MITAANFLTWCEVFGVPTGQGGGGGAVTERQVQQSAFNFAETTGSNDAFVVTLSPAVLTLTDGLIVTMNSGSLSNTSDSPTLQVDALPAKTITLWGGLPLLPSDITSNTVYLFLYDLSDDTFQLINPSISTANTTLVQANTYNAAIDTGVANAYVITLTPAPQGDFSEGFAIYFRATHTNTGASTITINGVEKAITLQGGSALPASVMSANGTYFCLYSTSLGNWILMNPAGSVVGVTSAQGTEYQVLVNGTFGELKEGALTFTLPQDIAPTSSPEFASATIGTAIIGTPDSFNLQIGLNTLSAIEFVGYSIAIGANAFANLAYAQDCVAIGYNAGTLLAGSNDNPCAYTTFIGSFAGSASTFAYASTFVGYGAGGNATTGSENSIFGANAGAGIIAGSYNTLLGAGTDVSADGSGMLAIGITAIADPATGSSSSDYGPGIAIGSSAAPIGFRGDGTAFPAGTGAVYWRTKINSTYYNIPLLTDGTDLQWPGTSGTLALVSDIPPEGIQSITGTTNQINVDDTDPLNPILSTPQDIAATSSPTFDNLTLTGGELIGSLGNVIVALEDTADAVNWFNFKNSADGSPLLLINAVGTSAAIPIYLQTQGDAGFTILAENTDAAPFTIINGTTGQHVNNFAFSQTGETRTITFPDGDGTVAFESYVDSVAVLLAPTADQTITGGYNLIVDANIQSYGGNLIAGYSGGVGHIFAYPPTSGMGYLEITATDNTGNYNNLLTNIATTADRTWSLPDADGTIALVGEIPSNNYVSDIVTSDSPTAISSATPKSICTLTLAPGNWMVGGNGTGVATGLINALVVGVSTIENAFNGDLSGPDASYPAALINGLYISGTGVTTQLSVGESAFNLTETTTFYLTIQYNTNGASGTAFGILYAYNYEP